MKKYFLLLIIMAHLSACTITEDQNPAKFSSVEIGEQKFEVEIANTNESRQKGLMFRENLEKNKGMLFIFDYEEKHSFWMKNTLIPLDIIWISKEKKVVDIQTMQPCIKNPCKSYHPNKNSQYALEVGAGVFHGKLGDNVKIDF
jgi:uncharacterized membrane protein (UPF0127 family)